MISLKRIRAGNITTLTSDHLTQFLIIRDQTTNLKIIGRKKSQKFDYLIKNIS